MKHQCNKSANGTDWSICSVCAGRIHLQGCKATRHPSTDCCERRHQILHEHGHVVGLKDKSLPMLGSHAT